MEPEPHQSLMRRAASLLARRAYSRGELREKLAKHAGRDAVESVLDRLEELNLLNDADYAYNFAARSIKQEGWGPEKVYHLLLRRRVAAPLAEKAVNRAREETDDVQALELYLDRICRTRGFPSDPKALRRMILRLRRRGFHEETVREVLGRRVPGELWRHFEIG